MNLYLSSYKLGNDVSYLKKWIKENDNKILLIKNARDTKEQNEAEKNIIQQNIKMLEELGFNVTILDLKEYFNKSDELKKFITNNYRAFCVIGGNVFILRKAMQLSGFDSYLKENHNNDDLLYIGYSAGICVLSPSLVGLELVDNKINIYNSDEIIEEGLGLIDYSIAPHYKSDHPESVSIDNLVRFFEKNKVKYKTLSDGEVIIENTN